MKERKGDEDGGEGEDDYDVVSQMKKSEVSIHNVVYNCWFCNAL